MIIIHFDFTDGTEVSYAEGKVLGDNFTTNCLDFFSFDGVGNVIIKDRHGNTLDRNKLLFPNQYTSKEIRKSHNIHKMFKAEAFNWQSKIL